MKILRQRHDEADLERLRRNMQLASSFDNLYVAHIYTFGSKDGHGWYATELVRGGVALKQSLEIHGPMPFEQLVPLFECIAQAIQAARDRGIVHRNLTSLNVLKSA